MIFSPSELFTSIPYLSRTKLYSNLIKSREYNVQNVSVSLTCSRFVSDDGVQ